MSPEHCCWWPAGTPKVSAEPLKWLIGAHTAQSQFEARNGVPPSRLPRRMRQRRPAGEQASDVFQQGCHAVCKRTLQPPTGAGREAGAAGRELREQQRKAPGPSRRRTRPRSPCRFRRPLRTPTRRRRCMPARLRSLLRSLPRWRPPARSGRLAPGTCSTRSAPDCPSPCLLRALPLHTLSPGQGISRLCCTVNDLCKWHCAS